MIVTYHVPINAHKWINLLIYRIHLILADLRNFLRRNKLNNFRKILSYNRKFKGLRRPWPFVNLGGIKAALMQNDAKIGYIARSCFDNSADVSSASPRSSNQHAERRSYLDARTYIRPARTRDISIVPSSACRGNNSAGATRGTRCVVVYTGPLVGSGRGENRARDRSLFILSPLAGLSSSPFLFSATDQRVFNYPDKIASRSLRLERWWPFILIHTGDLGH